MQRASMVQRALTGASLILFALGLMLAMPGRDSVAQSGAAKIVLVRHAEFGTTPGGALGPSLNEAGKERAAALAEVLSKEGVPLIVTTRFRRTSETAAIVGDRLGVKPVVVRGDDPDNIVDA